MSDYINIDDDSYIDKLKEIRKKEDALLERLISERLYLASIIKIDPLTGLYNRRIISKIRDIGTVIMCDIDNFKTINDTYGHDIGDVVLKSMGHNILDNIRIGDVGCRFGGDEFLIVFTTDNKDVIEARMKKIEADVNKEVSIPGRNITLSVGVVFNSNNETMEALMEKADKALYESKENGKNQITYYEPQKHMKKTKKLDVNI